MCFQAVWFMSRDAMGPWEVAQTYQEIYTIPASSPAHSVTYVTVEEDDNANDEWVTFAYVAAYTGMAVAWGCAVWGTGPDYPRTFATVASIRPLSVRAHVRVQRLVQPLHSAYGRGRLSDGPDRWRRRRGRLQPAHGNVCAWRRGVRAIWWHACGRAGLESAHRHLRGDATRFQHLRQLGIELRAAWR